MTERYRYIWSALGKVRSSQSDPWKVLAVEDFYAWPGITSKQQKGETEKWLTVGIPTAVG